MKSAGRGCFRKNNRILEIFLLRIEINIIMRICAKNLLTSLLYSTDHLGSTVILRKQEGFFAKQLEHRVSDTRPFFAVKSGGSSKQGQILTIAMYGSRLNKNSMFKILDQNQVTLLHECCPCLKYCMVLFSQCNLKLFLMFRAGSL